VKASLNEGAGVRPTVGVVGTGNMGAALVRGWLRAEEAGCSEGPGRLLVWDKIEAASRRLLTDSYVGVASSLQELAGEADVILVVVKPKDAAEVLAALAGLVRQGQVIVSSMSGLALEWMRGLVGGGPALFRIMPNLGVELGAGAIAFAAEPDAHAATVAAMKALLGPLGMVEEVPEGLFDVVTAVAGSGPAFLALAVESLEDGVVAAGLSRAVAREVIRKAALDTAALLSHHSDSAAMLAQHLLSTGSVDPEAMKLVENCRVGEAFQGAVGAAMRRSRQMGKV
jgi:pyrroline-5-carboxylate reductase